MDDRSSGKTLTDGSIYLKILVRILMEYGRNDPGHDREIVLIITESQYSNMLPYLSRGGLGDFQGRNRCKFLKVSTYYRKNLWIINGCIQDPMGVFAKCNHNL